MFLNALFPYQAYQVAVLALVQFYFSVSVARDKPCTTITITLLISM